MDTEEIYIKCQTIEEIQMGVTDCQSVYEGLAYLHRITRFITLFVLNL